MSERRVISVAAQDRAALEDERAASDSVLGKSMLLEKVTWQELVQFLETWSCASGDPYAYDVVGIMLLLRACVENLSRHSIEADYEELGDFFTPAQVRVLEQLLKEGRAGLLRGSEPT